MPDPTAITNVSVVGQCAIYAKETMGAKIAPSRYDDMRCEKAVIPNGGVVANVIPTPHDHVVPNFYERLDRIILKNEAMLADNRVRPDERS